MIVDEAKPSFIISSITICSQNAHSREVLEGSVSQRQRSADLRGVHEHVDDVRVERKHWRSRVAIGLGLQRVMRGMAMNTEQ